MQNADQITKEWEKIKKKVSSRAFINEVEMTMPFEEIRIFQHGKYEYNEFDIPQHMLSVTQHPAFKQAPVYLFTGILQWKNKEKSMVSKKVVIFNNAQNSAYEWDLFKDD